MNAEMSSKSQELYDAKLTGIDQDTGIATFQVAGAEHRVKSVTAAWWTVGTIGRLRLPPDAVPFSFYPYADQRLRRHPAGDDPRQNLWGWHIAGQHFAVKAGVIPGKDGLVVAQNTDILVVELPREFVDLCRKSRLTPQTVLRGFVADLCELMDWVNCPREDHYSSNGSDERRMARLYFDRAYGWLTADDETI